MKRKQGLVAFLLINFVCLSLCAAAEDSEEEIEIYFFYDSEPCTCHPEEKAANEIAKKSLARASEKYEFKLKEHDTDHAEGARKFLEYRTAYGGFWSPPLILIGNDCITRFKSDDETVEQISKLIDKYKKQDFYPNPSEIVNIYGQMDRIESAIKKDSEAKAFLEKAVIARRTIHIDRDTRSIKWFSYTGILEAELNRSLEPLTISVRPNIAAETETPTITESIPFSNRIDLSALNLPLATLLIALVDSFNPCVIFILLFLLSIISNLRSRRKILQVGMIFILVTGIFYFLFMTMWLNLFLLVDLVFIEYVKFAVGVVAIIVGIINIKDFFFFKKGISLTIPEAKKNRLFSKAYNLFSKPTTKSIIPGTIGVALFANLIELPCTGGFPPIYTMLLKINSLEPFKYYMYLLMYNFIYILPELVIVMLTAFTLGAKKFTERHGRILKIVSGIIILGLGFILVYA